MKVLISPTERMSLPVLSVLGMNIRNIPTNMMMKERVKGRPIRSPSHFLSIFLNFFISLYFMGESEERGFFYQSVAISTLRFADTTKTIAQVRLRSIMWSCAKSVAIIIEIAVMMSSAITMASECFLIKLFIVL